MIIAVDLGTSHSRVVAAIPDAKAPYGLNILYSEEMDSLGIKRGAVFNKDEAGKVLTNLLSAVDKKTARKKTQKSIVLVNIGGMTFSSSIVKKTIQLNGQTVSTRTLQLIEKQASADKEAYLLDESLLRTTAISYAIDDEPSTDSVINRSGSTLEAKYLCICGRKSAIAAINSAFPQKSLPSDMYPTASAKAAILLSPAQRRDGVALVDMGAGSTSIAVFYRDSLQFETVIPIGSDTITNDIAVGLEISRADAELIKRNIGIMDEGKSPKPYKVTFPGGSTVEFKGAKLNYIVKARVEEIGAYIYTALQEAIRRGCPKDIKLALTGGGARLKGLNKVMSDQTELNLTGTSCVSTDNVQIDKMVDFACAIGMASTWARENRETPQEQPSLQFEETPDPQPEPAPVQPEPQPETKPAPQPEPKADEEGEKASKKKKSALARIWDNLMNDSLNLKDDE